MQHCNNNNIVTHVYISSLEYNYKTASSKQWPVKMETYSNDITHNNGLLKWKLILTISFVIALSLALALLSLTQFFLLPKGI